MHPRFNGKALGAQPVEGLARIHIDSHCRTVEILSPVDDPGGCDGVGVARPAVIAKNIHIGGAGRLVQRPQGDRVIRKGRIDGGGAAPTDITTRQTGGVVRLNLRQRQRAVVKSDFVDQTIKAGTAVEVADGKRSRLRAESARKCYILGILSGAVDIEDIVIRASVSDEHDVMRVPVRKVDSADPSGLIKNISGCIY